MSVADDVSVDPLDLPLRGGTRVHRFEHGLSAAALLDWVRDGIDRRETVLLITSTTLQLRLVGALVAHGLPAARLIGDGRIVLLPVSVVVRSLDEGAAFDPSLVDVLLGGVLRSRTDDSPVRVLSEVADETLRQHGAAAAARVEEAWARTLSDLDVAVLAVADLQQLDDGR